MNMLDIEEVLTKNPKDQYITQYRENLMSKRLSVQGIIAKGLAPRDFSHFTLIHQALDAAVRVLNSVAAHADSSPSVALSMSLVQTTVTKNAECDTYTVRQVTELGFLAMGRGMTKEVQAIVAGLKAMRPQEATPYVIEALSALTLNNANQAERMLHEALSRVEDDELVNAFLAYVLKRKGEASKAEHILARIRASADAVTRNFAQATANMQ